MKIWMISPEMAPYSKVGGLGDVVGALPGVLGNLGAEVVVFIPHLPTMEGKFTFEDTGVKINVPIGKKEYRANLLTHSPAKNVRVVLIQSQEFFELDGLYGTPDGEHPDNALRFAFFPKAALLAGMKLYGTPDVIHSHDWPGALALLYARAPEHFGKKGGLLDVATVMSIHNLSYQGVFPKNSMEEIGIAWKRFTHLELEFWDQVNFLKGGLVHSDAIVAVSPTYAKEIQTPEHGWGLDGLLREKAPTLHGILNGLDTTSYNPGTDPLIPVTYDRETIAKKQKNKTALQMEMGLPLSTGPLVGVVSRFAYQKGLGLFVDIAERLDYLDFQWVLFGTGERPIEQALLKIAEKMRGRVAVKIGFSEETARRVYAGADYFFMPSLFEPCGLGQMIAMRYGAVPIVRRTGGLNDTVTDFGRTDGDGVLFDHPTGDDAHHALWRASELWRDREKYEKVRDNGMKRDFSWETSAKKYLELYKTLTA